MAKPDDRYVGLSDREAFVAVRDDVKSVVEYIRRMRGETTDEDLMNKVTWKCEAIAGMEEPDGIE